MAKRKEVSILAPQVALGRQDTTYKEILSVDGKKLQISIKSDSYKFQSHARIHVWNGDNEGWTVVHFIHHELMKTPEGLVYLPQKRGLELSHYKADRDELMKVALAILF